MATSSPGRFVELLLQRLDLLPHGVPVGARRRGHFFGVINAPSPRFGGKVMVMHSLARRRVEMIFLLDALAQVLDGHVFRAIPRPGRRAAPATGSAAALSAQLSRARHVGFLRLFPRQQFGVCAFTCRAACCKRPICACESGFRFRLSLRLMKTKLRRAGSDRLVSSRMRCSSDCCCWRMTPASVPRTEGHLLS